jgi:hypothetical protein
MARKERLCSFRYFANLEEWLLFRKALLCLLYLFLNSPLVCPMYTFLQSGQVSLCTSEDENLSKLWFFLCLVVLYGVICEVSYPYVWVFEYIRDICGFFTCVCECGSFTFWCYWALFLILLKVRRFMWLDWEGILMKDIMSDVLFLVVFFFV